MTRLELEPGSLIRWGCPEEGYPYIWGYILGRLNPTDRVQWGREFSPTELDALDREPGWLCYWGLRSSQSAGGKKTYITANDLLEGWATVWSVSNGERVCVPAG